MWSVIGVVCEFKSVWTVWDDGVDVSQEQPFKEFHAYICKCYGAFRQLTLVFMGTGTMVVCLKHVGINV
jgi:hypothetical protein